MSQSIIQRLGAAAAKTFSHIDPRRLSENKWFKNTMFAVVTSAMLFSPLRASEKDTTAAPEKDQKKSANLVPGVDGDNGPDPDTNKKKVNVGYKDEFAKDSQEFAKEVYHYLIDSEDQNLDKTEKKIVKAIKHALSRLDEANQEIHASSPTTKYREGGRGDYIRAVDKSRYYTAIIQGLITGLDASKELRDVYAKGKELYIKERDFVYGQDPGHNDRFKPDKKLPAKIKEYLKSFLDAEKLSAPINEAAKKVSVELGGDSFAKNQKSFVYTVNGKTRHLVLKPVTHDLLSRCANSPYSLTKNDLKLLDRVVNELDAMHRKQQQDITKDGVIIKKGFENTTLKNLANKLHELKVTVGDTMSRLGVDNNVSIRSALKGKGVVLSQMMVRGGFGKEAVAFEKTSAVDKIVNGQSGDIKPIADNVDKNSKAMESPREFTVDTDLEAALGFK